MNKSFYITTPIFYPTNIPHIGTAYNVFICDTLARYYRKKIGSENVFFTTGTDEHGANIESKAREEGIEPIKYVDNYANEYKKIWNELKISYNHFARTTDREHMDFASKLLQKSYDAGDIYEGEYEGWYCQSCESYYTEDDLIDKKCPNHPLKEPIFTKEKNYYFRLSKYRNQLLDYLETNRNFIKPEKWFQYILGLVKQGLKDIPISRANVKWGIPVPFDKTQTIYVWYDALPNYISTLFKKEYKGQDYFNKFWQNSVHVVGKDILRFHAILWPAMLFSAGYSLPKSILVTGFFTVSGMKIGKSNNNAINPVELAERYTLDGIRYALLSEFQIGSDGDFSLERLEVKYRGDLANNFGNLLNRTIHLAKKFNVDLLDEGAIDLDFKSSVLKYQSEYSGYMEEYRIFESIQVVYNLCSFGNSFINESAPWKDENELSRDINLKKLGYILKFAIEMYEPIIPDASGKAKEALNSLNPIILFPSDRN